MGQLVEQSIPTTPEVRGSNPVIGKKLYSNTLSASDFIRSMYILSSVNWIGKSKINEKRSGLAHFSLPLNVELKDS